MELASWDPGEMSRQDFLEKTQNACRDGVR